MRLRQNTTQCKELAILIFSLGLIIFLFLSIETYIYSILSAIKNNLLSIVSVGKKKRKKKKLDFILFIVRFRSLPGFNRPFFQMQIFLEEFNCLRSIEYS